MERAHDAHARERLRRPKLLARGHQARHLELSEVILLAPKVRERHVRDLEVAGRLDVLHPLGRHVTRGDRHLSDRRVERLLEESERVQDLEGALGGVERVEVQAGHQPTRHQLLAQVGHVPDPPSDELRLRLVALELLEHRVHRGRDACLTEAAHALEASVRVEGHDAREDGHRDPRRADLAHPVLEHVEIIKELRDDHVAARLDLLLEVCDLALHVLVRANVLLALDVHDAHLLRRRERPAQVLGGLDHVGVPLGVTGHLERKVVAVMLARVLDEVERAREAALGDLPLLLPLGRVAAQRDDVADARSLRAVEPEVALLLDLVSAGQMHVDHHVVARLRLGREVEGEFRSGTARTPGHVHKERVLRRHHLDRLVQLLHAFWRPGWEVLERDERLLRLGRPLSDHVADLALLDLRKDAALVLLHRGWHLGWQEAVL